MLIPLSLSLIPIQHKSTRWLWLIVDNSVYSWMIVNNLDDSPKCKIQSRAIIIMNIYNNKQKQLQLYILYEFFTLNINELLCSLHIKNERFRWRVPQPRTVVQIVVHLEIFWALTSHINSILFAVIVLYVCCQIIWETNRPLICKYKCICFSFINYTTVYLKFTNFGLLKVFTQLSLTYSISIICQNGSFELKTTEI